MHDMETGLKKIKNYGTDTGSLIDKAKFDQVTVTKFVLLSMIKYYINLKTIWILLEIPVLRMSVVGIFLFEYHT